MTYTSWNIKARRINTARDPEHRAQLAQRFKTTYASLGMSIDDVANLLHVTPRTLHNWNSGRYDIPYAAFKLLRVLMRYELPHDDWAGWHFSGGKLWTPEGYSIAPHESSWWSLLVRRAQMFSSLYARCHQLEAQLRDGGTEQPAAGDRALARRWRAPAQVTPHGAAGRAAQQPGPNSFIGHISTGGRRKLEPVRLAAGYVDTFPSCEKEKNHG